MPNLINIMSNNFIAIFLVAIAVVVMLWAVHFARALTKNRSGVSRPIYLPYTLYTVFISLWILSNAYFQSDLLVALGSGTATIMALLANLFSGLAFAFAFLFSCRLVSERNAFQLSTWQWILFVIACAITLATNVIPGMNVRTVDVSGIGNFVIHFGPASGAFFGILLLLVVLTLVNFIRSSRSTIRLKQVKATYMVMGMVGFILSTFLAHFLIPILLNDFSKAWLPPALSIIEAVLVGYALLHNRFYSSRYMVLISFSFIANAALYIIPIVVISVQDASKTSLLFALWTLVTGIFWNKSHAMIRRGANRLLYREKGNPVESICNLIGEFRYSTDEAVVKLNHVLNAKSGRIQKVANNAETNVYLSCFEGDRSVLVKEELEYQLKHDRPEDPEYLRSVAREMISAGTSLVLPITNDKSEVTHLYMVSKENESDLFSSEEIMGLQRLFDEANRFIVTEDKIRKSQVLAGSIAHEIRNPLTKIKYHFERIDADMFGVENASLSPFASQDMKKIYQELAEGKKAVQLGTRFIDAILDELRGDGISTELFEHYSAVELTKQALRDFSFYSDNHKNRININTHDDFLFRGSDTLYSFVLFNLLKNAIHYFDAFPNSRVNIHFRKSTDYNEIHLIDTGPGISTEHQAHIFDELYTKGKDQGNGLGLSYCKRVMQSFGGDITCRSLAGKFTEFVLSFPSIDQQVHDDKSVAILTDYMMGKSCLVIGNMQSQAWLTAALEILGADVILAQNIKLGFSNLCQQPVDFIMMDRMLLERDIDLVKALRAGDLGYQAQVTPILIYHTPENEDSEPPTGIYASNLVQGHLDGINQSPAFHRSLASLIDEGSLVKLGSLMGKRVLVVDDMQVNRLLVQAYLTTEGVTVVQAASGEEAIQKITNEPFDLIVMDIHMPGMGGIEATREIRRLRHDIPIVALSGEYSEEAIIEIQETMHDHLVKPITKQQLIKMLTTWLVQDTSSNKRAKTLN
ncbi:hybrid sensor histidine kinase/response regulator [Enterovibrio norvegicus FF-33]|uniref:hybrid sensor histidine kinase/response regulator n=1 Tax=Enterovibrio norvegicus TaxID=188144 RepID=UPI0003768A09|nr:hybrid sensor histidine kinase/response regulator [Enterovibrio norvegicus]OEE65944.1 hybrid sensor histidine kinase/response regulator [Enterovibrio norvegicus FF-33]